MLQEIKRYQVRRQIGKGSMADVYEVYDPHTDRLLAIKILREDRRENNDYLQRFFREAKAVGSLSHPNIVSIYDIDEFEKSPFIVMEHLKGTPLSEGIKSGRKFSFHEIIAIGLQLSLALDYAHSRGIIHRDIKPSNIIITTNTFKVKITDFGIAHFEDPEVTMKTRVGDVLGTPQYMSPEQVQGQRVDGRSDLFSVGVILYQLLTGERPFTGDTIPTLMHNITTMQPRPLTSLGPEVPKSMRYIVHKLLEKKADDRYQNGKELADALRQASINKNKEPKKIKKPGENNIATASRKWGKPAGIAAAITLMAITSFAGYKLINKSPLPGSIKGAVLNGNSPNTVVSIYPFDENLILAPDLSSVNKISESITDEQGSFEVALNIESQPVLLVAQFDKENPEKILSATINYEEGVATPANLTVFSHMASGLTINNALQGEKLDAAVNSANTSVADFAQVKNLHSNKLVAIDGSSATNPTDSDKYSIIHQGLYRILSRANQSNNKLNNQVEFAQLAYADIRVDGKLDGRGENGSLHFGVRALSPKHLRENLADSIMQIAQSFQSDEAVNNYYKIALVVNDSSASIFDGEPNTQLGDTTTVKLVAKHLARIEKIRKKFGSSENKTEISTSNDEPIASKSSPPSPVQKVNTKLTNTGIEKTTITGVANIGGLLKNAKIRVVDLSDDSNSSNIIGTSYSDDYGTYSIKFDNENKSTVLVAAYGGLYRELITKEKVTLPENQLVVCAVINVEPGDNINVNLTYFTHMAAALAQYLIKVGSSPYEAQKIAHERMTKIAGFEYVNAVPTNNFSKKYRNGHITPELANGMFNAAVSNLTLDLSHTSEFVPHTQIHSARYAHVAYSDLVHDGLLNGVSVTGGISMGRIPITVQFYRRSLAQSLLSVAKSNLNGTGIKFNQFFAIASQYNESNDAMFADAPIAAIHSDGPLITRLNPGKETTISGTVEISAKVNDAKGIQEAHFWLGSTYLGNAKNPLSPSLKFNTRRFPSGLHKLKINVLNMEGKEASLTNYVYLNNKGPNESKN